MFVVTPLVASGSGSGTPSNIAYVDTAGSDSTGTVGNSSKPFLTPVAAAAAIATARGSLLAVTSLVYSGGVVTATVASTAAMTTGDTVRIQGSSKGEDNQYHNVTVASGTTFTYTSATSGARTGTIKYEDYTTLTGYAIYMGVGTFAMGLHGHLRPGDKVNVIGSGMNGGASGGTTISSTGTTTLGNVFNPGSGSYNANFLIQGDATINVFSFVVGADFSHGDTASFDVIMDRVWVAGWSDGLYFRNTTGLFPLMNWQCFDCKFITNYDTHQFIMPVDNSASWPLTIEFFDCFFQTTWNSNLAIAGNRGVVQSADGETLRFYGGRIISIGNASSSVDTIGICANAGSTIELYGTSIVTQPNGGSGKNISIQQQDTNSLVGAMTVKASQGSSYDASLVQIDNGGGNVVALTGLPGRSPWTVATYTAAVQSNNTPSETDLFTTTTACNTLVMAGDILDFHAAGTFSATVTATKRVRMYFAGTLIYDSGALTSTAAGSWSADARIIVKNALTPGSVTADAEAVFRVANISTALSATTRTALTGLTISGGSITNVVGGTNIIKITGLTGGTGTAVGDVTATSGNLVMTPAT